MLNHTAPQIFRHQQALLEYLGQTASIVQITKLANPLSKSHPGGVALVKVHNSQAQLLVAFNKNNSSIKSGTKVTLNLRYSGKNPESLRRYDLIAQPL